MSDPMSGPTSHDAMQQRLDALVGAVRAAVTTDAQKSDQKNAQAAPDAEDAATYDGEAADGAVRAAVDSAGKVVSLEIDAALFKGPLADVADAATAAINAALDARPGRVDVEPLLGALKNAQEQAHDELGQVDAGMADAERRVRAGAPRIGPRG